MKPKTESKRPLLIAVLCYVGFIGAFIVSLGLFVPEARAQILEQYGAAFLVISIIVALIGLVGLIGYWKMRKWGLYVYSGAMAISVSYAYFAGISSGMGSYVMPAVIIISGLAYFKSMR